MQTKVEERMEIFDQEIHKIKKEIEKLPTIEKMLNEILKNMERQDPRIRIDLRTIREFSESVSL